MRWTVGWGTTRLVAVPPGSFAQNPQALLKTITDIERLEAVATITERMVDIASRQRFTSVGIEDLVDTAAPVLPPREHGEFHDACAALISEPTDEAWLTLAHFAQRFRRRAAVARRRIRRRATSR